MARAPRKLIPKRKPRKARRSIPDSQQLAGIKQGVGRAVARAFGATVSRRKNRRGGRRGPNMSYNPCVHDAFHMHHLPLPRPVGPYTVIRTTQVITSKLPLMILGPVYDPDNSCWTNICGYGALDIAKKWTDADSLFRYVFESLSKNTWNAAQVVPSAFSVQVMNPGALQTTHGIVYGGRIRTAYKVTSQSGKIEDSCQELVSYNMPRLMASAKLAFRGVQVDAVPFNMARLSDFSVVETEASGTTAVTGKGSDFAGFNPQFYFNPDKIELQYLVCCEWRVRFDPSNPAQASHVQHTHADESIWMRALHAAEAMGNGVVDIADKVAQTGNAIFGATAGAYRAARGMRALGGAAQLALA